MARRWEDVESCIRCHRIILTMCQKGTGYCCQNCQDGWEE